MWSGFAIDYAILVFFGTLGVLQVVAAKNCLGGITLLRNHRLISIWIGFGTVAVAFIWFFAAESRNVPDTGAGLEANTQAATFAIAGASAVAVTFAIASIVNHRWAAWNSQDFALNDVFEDGMDALRQTTFVLAVVARFRHWHFLLKTRGFK